MFDGAAVPLVPLVAGVPLVGYAGRVFWLAGRVSLVALLGLVPFVYPDGLGDRLDFWSSSLDSSFCFGPLPVSTGIIYVVD